MSSAAALMGKLSVHSSRREAAADNQCGEISEILTVKRSGVTAQAIRPSHSAKSAPEIDAATVRNNEIDEELKKARPAMRARRFVALFGGPGAGRASTQSTFLQQVKLYSSGHDTRERQELGTVIQTRISNIRGASNRLIGIGRQWLMAADIAEQCHYTGIQCVILTPGRLPLESSGLRISCIDQFPLHSTGFHCITMDTLFQQIHWIPLDAVPFGWPPLVSAESISSG
ncbi:hypothetical protein DFH08DRAFT_822307 [Mycena albidolilacea]|uniref:Uncharacterized protein n=1 Tax=Mycena albidolilacea TaxID=1033008 RepID=A0AAD7ED80_9AGAR|nr:hypothetical protein DFH08DRAFT_822307 [Mycena albidolilacea]